MIDPELYSPILNFSINSGEFIRLSGESNSMSNQLLEILEKLYIDSKEICDHISTTDNISTIDDLNRYSSHLQDENIDSWILEKNTLPFAITLSLLSSNILYHLKQFQFEHNNIEQFSLKLKTQLLYFCKIYNKLKDLINTTKLS
jgi:hypothetical protein